MLFMGSVYPFDVPVGSDFLTVGVDLARRISVSDRDRSTGAGNACDLPRSARPHRETAEVCRRQPGQSAWVRVGDGGERARRGRWRAGCALVGLGIALPVGIAALELRRLETVHMRAKNALRADHLLSRLESQLRFRISLLEAVAQDVGAGRVRGPDAFEDRIRALIRAFPDYQAINWVNEAGIISWVVPLEDNLPAEGSNLLAHPEAGPTLEDALSSGRARATGPLTLKQGGRGFAIYVPVPGPTNGGAVNGVFRLAPLVSGLLPPRLRSGFDVTLASPNEPRPPDLAARGEQRTLEILGRTWLLAVEPTAESMEHLGRSSMLLALFGLGLAALISRLTYDLLASRERSFKQENHRRALLSAVHDHMVRLDQNLRTVAYHCAADRRRLPCHLAPEQWMPPRLRSSVERARVEERTIESEVELEGRTFEVRMVPYSERHVVVSLRDVSARRSLENERVLLAGLVASSPHLLAIITGSGRLEYLNPTGLSMLDLKTPPETLEAHLELGADALATLEGEPGTWSGRLTARPARSEDFPVHVTCFAIPTAVGLRLGVVAVDLRRTIELEEQVLRAHKLDALATLAAGVAHDFNNALTVFNTGLELLETGPTLPPSAQEDVSILRSAATNASHVAQQLLTFSRPRPKTANPQSHPIDTILAKSAPLLSRVVREDIELRWELQAPHTEIFGEPGALQQILLNLVINARDAIEGAGTITIRTRLLSRPRLVRIEVEDDGAGMDAEVLDKAFEPFFTTKVGQGSGLGLANVHQLVDDWGGQTEVDSEPGRGTVVRMNLPFRAVLEATPARTKPDLTQVRRARIVLADDDPALRTLVGKALRRAGHEVRHAANGLEALELLQAPTDVLVTDLVMPRMGGLELSRAARRSYPSVHVLLLSGYEDAPNRATKEDDFEWVAKPLDSATLLSRIESAMTRVPRVGAEPSAAPERAEPLAPRGIGHPSTARGRPPKTSVMLGPPQAAAASTPPIIAPNSPGVQASAPVRNKPGTLVSGPKGGPRKRAGTTGSP